MSKRYWDGQSAPFIVVIVGLLIVGVLAFELASDRERTRYEQQRTADYAQNAEAHIQRTCVGMDAVAQAVCIREIVKATNEHQRAERDLSAQQEMARWALYMLIATVATVIVTGVGVYYVRRTLAESVRATNAAVDAAKAGLKANEIAEDAAILGRRMGQAQVRAYLSCVGGSFSAYRGFLTLAFSARNTGQSPAMQCFINYRVRWFSSETGEIWLPEKQVEAFFIGAGLEETTGGYLSSSDGLTAEMSESFRANDMIVSGECVMKWTDIFGMEFTQHFFFHEIGDTHVDESSRSGKLKATNVRPRRLAGQQQQG